ncbi:DNA polymerase III subunit alpha, partial [Tenacibaculum maritimum]|nr:DNA polymerase III subunit alpha [Tenacibaculum maritimum]
GVGSGAVKAIIDERQENGPYKSIFDVAKRIDLRAANKKAFEGLVLAGGFDSFTNTHRAQYYVTDEKGQTFLEKAIRYGNKFQESQNSSQVSLFGEASEIELPEPIIPVCDTWGTMELLGKEKEVIGMYISAHPLDDFKNELKFCNAVISNFKDDLKKYEGLNLSFAGILSDVQHRVSKMGKGWAMFTIEDYNDSYEFRVFGEDYLKFKHYLVPNSFLFIKTTVQPGWVNKDGVRGEPRLKFTDFKLLHDIMDEMCKKLTLKIPLHQLKENFIKDLQHLIVLNRGTQNLYFTIWDADEKIELNLPSRNTKVKISNEFLKALDEQFINYKLN